VGWYVGQGWCARQKQQACLCSLCVNKGPFGRRGFRGKGRARGIKAVDFQQGTWGMGIRDHEQGTAFPSQGVFFFKNYTSALIFISCMLDKKGSMCRMKIIHVSGSESCICSWYTSLHGSEQLGWHWCIVSGGCDLLCWFL
jgi:hypothetical protein